MAGKQISSGHSKRRIGTAARYTRLVQPLQLAVQGAELIKDEVRTCGASGLAPAQAGRGASLRGAGPLALACHISRHYSCCVHDLLRHPHTYSNSICLQILFTNQACTALVTSVATASVLVLADPVCHCESEVSRENKELHWIAHDSDVRWSCVRHSPPELLRTLQLSASQLTSAARELAASPSQLSSLLPPCACCWSSKPESGGNTASLCNNHVDICEQAYKQMVCNGCAMKVEGMAHIMPMWPALSHLTRGPAAV